MDSTYRNGTVPSVLQSCAKAGSHFCCTNECFFLE